MTCQDMNLLLSEYLDGTLEPEWESMLHQHLQVCSPCKECLLDLMRTQRLMSYDIAVSPCNCDTLWTALAPRLAEEGITRSRLRRLTDRLKRPPLLPTSAAAAAIVAICAYYLAVPSQQPAELAQSDVAMSNYWREHTYYHQQLAGPFGSPELGILRASYREK